MLNMILIYKIKDLHYNYIVDQQVVHQYLLEQKLTQYLKIMPRSLWE